MNFLNENCKTFKNTPLRQLHHMYDTLNAHVFSALEQNLVIKIAKTQLKKGVLDLIFESQLQAWLVDSGFSYANSLKEELFEVAHGGRHITNYIVIEERRGQKALNALLSVQDFVAKQ